MSAIDSSPGTSPRVALLAREGRAREQLRGALIEAGAQIVLEGDPNTLDVQTLLASRPHAVLVALEPAIEDALFRLDPVLCDPGLTVIYDEADLASSREGWDAQRWARHLSAKLHGHRDVLPPGAEAELPQSPEPGRPQAPALVEDAERVRHLNPAAAQFSSLPDEPVFGGTLTLVDDVEAQAQPEDAFAIDLETWTPPPSPPRLELLDTVTPADAAGQGTGADPATAPQVSERTAAPAPPSTMHLSLVEDFQVVMPVRAEAVGPPPLPLSFGGLKLELESMEPPAEEAVAVDAVDAAGAKVPGAVLLFAGIGGPDAVRRVLAGLPASLKLPVLVNLRLDGGRYDNLAKQIQRVSPLPVMLASAGMAARGGCVYVVPDDVAAGAVDGLVSFADGHTDVAGLLGAMPPGRTAVLLLSGADAALAEPAVMASARGLFVSGQSLNGCYDWAASQALEQMGGTTASPETLAARVLEHFGV